jgi:hypothetical protein
MRHSLSLGLSLGLSLVLASLAGCGGGGNDAPFNVGTSAASAALTTPGAATISADGGSVTLAGGNATTTGCSGGQFGFSSAPCTVTAQVNQPGGTFSFDWSYTTKDTSGPGADLFGMLVDGTPVPLSDPGGALTQSGRREVTATNSLTFYLNCTDCTEGAAQATVSGLQRK